MTPSTHPHIPVGLGTKLGLLAASVGALVAATAAILDGDHSEETITGLLVAAVTVYGVVRGRSDQAAAALAHPAPAVGDPLDVELLADAALDAGPDGPA